MCVCVSMRVGYKLMNNNDNIRLKPIYKLVLITNINMREREREREGDHQ